MLRCKNNSLKLLRGGGGRGGVIDKAREGVIDKAREGVIDKVLNASIPSLTRYIGSL